jgi:hypothetical protein
MQKRITYRFIHLINRGCTQINADQTELISSICVHPRSSAAHSSLKNGTREHLLWHGRLARGLAVRRQHLQWHGLSARGLAYAASIGRSTD